MQQNQSLLSNLYFFDNNFQLDDNYSYKSLLAKFNSSYQSTNLLINDVYKNTLPKEKEILDIPRVTAYNDDNITTDISAQLSLFVINNNRIKIPSKVEHVIRKYVSRKLLKEIHKDIDVAIELCLLFCTQLNSTYFDIKNGSQPSGWKSLRAEYLRDFLSLSPLTYKKVITALEEPLKKGAILECDHVSIIGEKNHFYRLTPPYLGKGIVSYDLKTKEAIALLNRHYYRVLGEAKKNPICENLIRFYQDISLPSMDQIKKEANRLIALGYVTKKDKKLTKLNKHARSYYKNHKELSFVEDAIEIFEYLTDNGLLLPTVGGEASGGRVVDSFTLMPSWIRNLVLVNGKTLVESDYSCLHPNITITLYDGSTSYLTHGDLGSGLNIDVKTVKKEHLSFFNKEVWQMKQSPLYPYYQQNEPIMLQNVIAEKYNSPFKHKITSRRLFAKEVEVMTAVIQQLNKEGIFVGYVYDALFFHPDYAKRVKEVMDTVIQQYGIKTVAKLSNEEKQNPIMDSLKETKVDLKAIKSKHVRKVEKTKVLEIDVESLNFSDRIKSMLQEKIINGEQLDFVDATIVFGKNDTIKDKVLMIQDRLNPKANYVIQSHILGSA
jgi:transcriptional regulator